MSTRRTRALSVAVVAALALAAIASVFWIGWISRAHLAAHDTAHVSRDALSMADNSTPARFMELGSIGELNARITGLETGVAVGAASSETKPMPKFPSPEDTKRRAIRERDAFLERFAREGRDASWARVAEKSLRRDLDLLSSKIGVDVADVQCGTTICIAHVQWPTYGAARETLVKVATAHFELNCRRNVYIPTPDDLASRYSGDLVLDCEQLRAEGN